MLISKAQVAQIKDLLQLLSASISEVTAVTNSISSPSQTASNRATTQIEVVGSLLSQLAEAFKVTAPLLSSVSKHLQMETNLNDPRSRVKVKIG